MKNYLSRDYFDLTKQFIRKMRTTCLMILVFASSLLASNVNSQVAKVNIAMKNAYLIEVIREIESQTDYLFVYDKNQIDLTRRVDLVAENKSVTAILSSVFSNTNVVYAMEGNNIMLMQKSDDQQPQQKSVSGKVTDSSGNSLPGVSVVVKGTTTGVIIDMNGNYTISNVPENTTLQFSFVGMKTQEIAVARKTTLNVVMEEDAIGIEEVVAIGYGTQTKANITGAVSTVNSKQLTLAPQSSTVNALVGNVPGLISRQISGEPGRDAPDINIRGFGTALVIVDGVEQKSFNNLDPNEIETVTVLKDASAAIYGARAGNGVILVTSKRGKIGKPSFSLNSSYTMQGITRYPKLLNAGQYTELVMERQKNDGVPEANWKYKPEDVQKYYDGTDPKYPNTDWWGLTVRDWAPQNQHNISMRGGNEKIRYYGLIGTMSQEGFHKTGDNKYSRYNIRSNVDADITENLTASIDISYMISDLVAPRRSTELVFQDLFSTQPFYPASYPDPTKFPQTGTPQNPIINSDINLGGYQKNFINTANITSTLSYKFPFIKGLEATGFFNYSSQNSRSKNWSKQMDVYSYDYDNDLYTVSGRTEPTVLSQGTNFNRTLTSQVSLNYKNNFGKHHVSALVLHESIDQYAEGISGSRSNYLSNAIDYLFAGGDADQNVTGSASEFGRASYVGRFNYDYNQKYLLQLTTRYDASPKFPSENRWGFFPSVSLGWRLSEESFLKNSNVVDNLKLRLSYSNTGYDATGDFQYLTGYQLAGSYLFNGSLIKGISSTGLTNPNIFWEDLKTYNVGIDYSLWKNKLYGELDVFYRERSGMLATKIGSLPNTFGATLPAENLNSQNNRGFELMLGHRGNINEFRYSVEGHVSFTRAKWDHFDEPDYTDEDDIRIRKKSGNWVNRAFSYQSDGLFQTQEEINGYLLDQDNKKNSTIRPGDIKYVDYNADGILNWRDQVETGRGPVPEVMFGLNTQLQYKTFDLNMLLQGAAGNDLTVGAGRFLGDDTFELVFKNHWTPENPDALIPRRSSNAATNSFNSDYWMVDGSYLRLKTVALGYTIPNRITKSAGVENVRFSISGTNLLSFDNVTKFLLDPEIPNGTSGLYYPQQRTVSMGVNLSF